jgi:type VI secretion system protein VasD
MKNIGKGLVFFTLLLSGCSSTPEKIKVAPINTTIKITVSAQVNPDVDKRTSPIVIRIFKLKSLGNYNESDFYGLFEDYESVLGSDLLSTEQIHLNPGDVRTLKHKTIPEAQYFAVVAAYRDINQAIWRDFVTLATGKTTQVLVVVDKLNISVWKK